MAAVGSFALRALKRLCCVAVFISQLYVLSGRGSLSLEHSPPQAPLAKIAGVPTSTHVPASKVPEGTSVPTYVTRCPSNGICSRLPPECMACRTNYSCVYGKPVTFECEAKSQVHCVGQSNSPQKTFLINMTCQFCWQLPPSSYLCSNPANCKTVSCPRERYSANCTVKDHVHCLGNRTFPKMLYCNWTGGYKWSTALALRRLFSWEEYQDVVSCEEQAASLLEKLVCKGPGALSAFCSVPEEVCPRSLSSVLLGSQGGFSQTFLEDSPENSKMRRASEMDNHDPSETSDMEGNSSFEDLLNHSFSKHRPPHPQTSCKFPVPLIRLQDQIPCKRPAPE